MPDDENWTPRIGVIRGLCTGAVAAFTFGSVIVVAIWWLTDPTKRSSSMFGGFNSARMVIFGGIPIAFVYTIAVIGIGEWAGNMSSRWFCLLGACSAIALGLAVTQIALEDANWKVGNTAPQITALIWVGLPIAGAGLLAAAGIWQSRSSKF